MYNKKSVPGVCMYHLFVITCIHFICSRSKHNIPNEKQKWESVIAVALEVCRRVYLFVEQTLILSHRTDTNFPRRSFQTYIIFQETPMSRTDRHFPRRYFIHSNVKGRQKNFGQIKSDVEEKTLLRWEPTKDNCPNYVHEWTSWCKDTTKVRKPPAKRRRDEVGDKVISPSSTI